MDVRPSHKGLFAKLKKKVAAATDFASDLKLKASIIASMRFSKQNDLAKDPSRFIAVTCGRRAGKSTGSLTIALERCMEKDEQSWCIIGLTRPSIKRIYWRMLKKLNLNLDLNLQWNETELHVTFPNGSILQFLGAENASEIEKIRGNAYHGVIIDECKSFNHYVFAELIEDVIRPSLSDYEGVLILIGTPGKTLGGTFYEATHWPSPLNGAGQPINIRYGSKDWALNKALWSSHHWDARDNEPMPQIWADFQYIKKQKGWDDSNPIWCREYLGMWVVDNTHRVFRYNPETSDFTHEFDGPHGLPAGHEWNLVMGLDPGHDDPFAFVLLAYSPTHPNLYNIYSYSGKGINVTAAAKMIKEIEREFGEVETRVGDRAGLGKLIFSELAEHHDIFIERAEKGEKEDIIELINDDLDQGLCKIERGSQLAVELGEHKWESKGGKRVESKRTINDCADAFVYAYRFCEHKRWKAKLTVADAFSQEWYDEMEKAEIAAVIKRTTESEETNGKDWW